MSKLAPLAKASLLQRCVVSNFRWKLSRWPFQKSVAVDLDKTQCQMMARILPCPRGDSESVDHYCRRRLRNARKLCNEIGLWSVVWCDRVIAWHDHLLRAQAYNHFCFLLLSFHDERWLLLKRSEWVPTNSNMSVDRVSLRGGRSGTRLNIGRPQVRWEKGVENARHVVCVLREAGRTNKPVSFATIFNEVMTQARTVAEQFGLSSS